MNNFTKRALTGAVFVTVLLGCTYWGQVSFAVLFFIITILGVWEFYGLAEKTNAQPQKLFGTLVSASIFATSALVAIGYFSPSFLLINIPLIFSIFIVELYSKASNPFKNIAFTLVGVVYIAAPFSLLNFITLVNGNYSYQMLFGFFFILWSNDTGAYLAGSALGKNKLFARVSPGKSWEGSIGGAILSLVVAYLISEWFTQITLFDWIIIAIILIVVGTLGDLVESLFKRSIGVKDSGTILPGHGGILDRFDSLILASPFVFTYLYCVKNYL
ncbi:MAG: phosphatidate cytidylyltransferase [Bacteroidia bacterium]